MKKITCSLVVALPLSIVAPCAFAINGLALVGYGFEATMLGGADVAVARDAFAANNNPAGMTQLDRQALDGEFVTNQDVDISHDDAYNEHKPRADRSKAYIDAAYARPLEDRRFAAGVAAVVQGGFGWTYRGMNVNPAFGGGRDDMAALFAVLKLAPAFAWKVNDQLSVGAALGINYFGGEQTLFPNTTAGPVVGGFHGFRFKDAGGFGFNGKVGLQYRPADDVTVGFTYGSGTTIPIKGGNLRLNLGNGLGVVRYDNAELQGFHLPEEFSLGVAFRPRADVLVSVQAKHYIWSDAMKTLTIVASNPRDAAAPPLVAIGSSVDMRDQDILGLGAAYTWTPRTTLYGGFNYGTKTLPDRNVNPIFAPITQRHLMAGFSHALDAEWQLQAGLEWFLSQTATYNNPLFGNGASEHCNNVNIHFAASRRW